MPPRPLKFPASLESVLRFILPNKRPEDRMKIYRTFVRASHRDMKGVDLTDREVSDYIGTVRIESQFQVNALAPFLSDYAERLKAYNQKKRAQAAANVRWSKNQKKTV